MSLVEVFVIDLGGRFIQSRFDMVSVPGFLLRRLYVKGSLKNDAGGFEFQLVNSLGAGYAHKVWPLKLDGKEIPAERSYFILDGKETPFSAVSEESAFTLAMNKAITVWSDGVALAQGPHTVEMGFDVPGLGSVRFDFTDEVADG